MAGIPSNAAMRPERAAVREENTMIRIDSKRIAAVSLLMLAGLTTPSVNVAVAASAKAIQSATEALRAGGKTLVGPGVYVRQPNVTDYAVQLTQDTNVCGTVTLIEGDGVQLNLEDALAVNLQGVIANTTLRTAAGCSDGVRNVELMCMGAVPCTAVWRVDAR